MDEVKKPAQHGGRRPGAGRPKGTGHPKRLSPADAVIFKKNPSNWGGRRAGAGRPKSSRLLAADEAEMAKLVERDGIARIPLRSQSGHGGEPTGAAS